MENDNLKYIIGAFLVVMVGIPLLMAIDEAVNPITRAGSNTNESMNFVPVIVTDAGNQTINESLGINLSNNDIASITRISNGTGGGNIVLTLNTDYWTNYSQYNIVFINSSNMIAQILLNNLTYADYTYYQDTYVKDATARVLVRLVLIFFVLAIVALVIYYSLEKTGLYKFEF